MKLCWDQEKYISAYRFAAEAHQGQLLPGTDLPYIMHISRVSMEIIAALSLEIGLDGNLAVQCSLLHDVVEDTTVTSDELTDRFGIIVSRGVQALSKNKKLGKHLQMADCLRRIQEQPREVWMVKLADRIDNLQPPPGDWTAEKRAAYKKEAELIHEALCPASDILADRLMAKIHSYERYLTL